MKLFCFSETARFAHHKNRCRGFTLIEALIYIVLFTIVIGGGMATAFYLIQGTDDLRREALAEAEANFVLRRIDLALSQAETANVVSENELSAGGITIKEKSVDGVIVAVLGPSETQLVSGNNAVDLKFSEVSNPAGIETILTINERVFHKIHYLR